MKNWDKYGIDISKVRGGKGFCPKCHGERKNHNDRELSVNIERGLFNCHHCGYAGCVIPFVNPKKEYTKPQPRLQKVSDELVKWFEEKRGISNNTLLRFGITESVEWMPKAGSEIRVICFNYLKDGELVNIKFRGKDKDFRLNKDSELIFYNLDAIKGEKEAVIVEGEMDCLALYEAGIYNVVSVPNGANKGSQKLEYLDNCWQYFEDKERIILMTDNDEPGQSLRDEISRRLGRERCFKVKYPEGCKDANDTLLNGSKTILREVYESAAQWPIDGVFTTEEMFEDVLRFYQDGYPKGTSLGIPQFDEYLSLVPGQLTIVTGIPGSGKSEFVDYMVVQAAKLNDWNWGLVGFEQPAVIHFTKLIEKHAGKSFGFRKNPDHRISQAELENGVGFVDRYFSFMKVDEIDVTIDGLIEKFTELVKRKGIKGLVIDPWNYIEYKAAGGQSETQYINECLTKLVRFLKTYDVHGILIAHPTKLKKEGGKYEMPTLYSISGSAHFFNKTHNGFVVYRDFESNVVDISIQKVKYSWLGKIGSVSFNYNTDTRQYTPMF